MTWNYRLEIKQFIPNLEDDQESTEAQRKTARDAIVAAMKEWKSTVELMSTFKVSKLNCEVMLEDCDKLIEEAEFAEISEDEFNNWLDSIYSWGDDFRVLVTSPDKTPQKPAEPVKPTESKTADYLSMTSRELMDLEMLTLMTDPDERKHKLDIIRAAQRLVVAKERYEKALADYNVLAAARRTDAPASEATFKVGDRVYVNNPKDSWHEHPVIVQGDRSASGSYFVQLEGATGKDYTWVYHESELSQPAAVPAPVTTFKVGDRVQHRDGTIGTVVEVRATSLKIDTGHTMRTWWDIDHVTHEDAPQPAAVPASEADHHWHLTTTRAEADKQVPCSGGRDRHEWYIDGKKMFCRQCGIEISAQLPVVQPQPAAVPASDEHYRDLFCAECTCTRRHFNIEGTSQWCCSMCKHLQTHPALQPAPAPQSSERKAAAVKLTTNQRDLMTSIDASAKAGHPRSFYTFTRGEKAVYSHLLPLKYFERATTEAFETGLKLTAAGIAALAAHSNK